MPDKANLSFKVRNIGPIISLDSQLSSRPKNMIFATNGLGKSFLSRAIRGLANEEETIEEKELFIKNLLSEEASEGELELKLGNKTIAQLLLDRKTIKITRVLDDVIFHVFNSDYVEEELQSNSYELDGKIEHEIIVGRENREILQKENALRNDQILMEQGRKKLTDAFHTQKLSLQEDYSIRANLSQFQNLEIENYLDGRANPAHLNPGKAAEDFAKKKEEYNSYKRLPNDPERPIELTSLEGIIPFSEISEFIEKPISISAVADKYKEKIRNNTDFFKAGVELFGGGKNECPFCEQDIGDVAQNVIDNYLSYFADEEAKAIERATGLAATLDKTGRQMEDLRTLFDQQQIRFSELRGYFPKFASNSLELPFSELKQLKNILPKLRHLLDEKLRNLQHSLDAENILEKCESDNNTLAKAISIKINQANGLIRNLNITLDNTDEARRDIQRGLCTTFYTNFYLRNAEIFEKTEALRVAIAKQQVDLGDLKLKSGEKLDARKLVADTFSKLLEIVFHGKYAFSEDIFRLRREKSEIKRNVKDTLSDGEKSLVAFCYFLAQTHMRVSSAADYKKIFFVIDDPVTSLSFDFIYRVIFILKRIATEEQINPIVSEYLGESPPILLLTHNDYFFNIAFNNRVFKADAVFQLSEDGATHRIEPLKDFITPHKTHLDHIWKVSEGIEAPTAHTANSARYVIESIQRFCEPSSNLGTFLKKLLQDGFEINSVVINDLSHGGKHFYEGYIPTDIQKAAVDTIAIVEKYASGQLIKLKKTSNALT